MAFVLGSFRLVWPTVRTGLIPVVAVPSRVYSPSCSLHLSKDCLSPKSRTCDSVVDPRINKASVNLGPLSQKASTVERQC